MAVTLFQRVSPSQPERGTLSNTREHNQLWSYRQTYTHALLLSRRRCPLSVGVHLSVNRQIA
jgi:hypothetical protein